MYLKKVTLILIFSMIASFCIRIIGTLFPSVFQNIAIVKATILINVFFILTHLLFWLTFFSEFISVKKPALKTSCLLAVAGSFAVSILYLKKFPLVFDLNPQFPQILASPYFDAIVPLISAVCQLVFFMFFKNALEPGEASALKRPVISIISGICIYMGLHLIVIVNFIVTDRFEWLEHMPQAMAIATVPLIIAAVCLILFFYYRFYSFLKFKGV
jgi:hypothetical protein